MNDTAFSRAASVDPDKKIDAFTVKCSPEFKSLLYRIAEADGMEATEFVRVAVQNEIERRRSMYEALHSVFGQATEPVNAEG